MGGSDSIELDYREQVGFQDKGQKGRQRTEQTVGYGRTSGKIDQDLAQPGARRKQGVKDLN